MKTIFIYVLLLIAFPAFSQNKEISMGRFRLNNIYQNKGLAIRKSISEMSILADKSVADHNTLCLIRYHNERMASLLFEIGALVLGSASAMQWNGDQANSTSSHWSSGTLYQQQYSSIIASPAGIMAIVAGVAGVTGIVLHIDAEKWINQKHLRFTGDKLTLNF